LGELFVIRHAQASFGQADYDRLSELGFRQTRLLEAFFNRIGTRFQAIYSGSLKRQVDTAEPLRSCFRADVPQQELSILPEFNEYDSSAVIRTQLPHLIREDPSLEQDIPRLQADRRALQRILDRSLSRSTFKFNRECLTLSSFNNVAHLEMKREPELLTYR